jgi:phosphatidylinositol-3,4,5-trisphosphate 3-phosphatase/dual-specificity protein phosphatase PTEN
VQVWLAEHPDNIAVIHCKAGKGRTGTMICAWFLFSGMWKTPDEAFAYYGVSRTNDQKGVTIPSQKRYVRYFHEFITQHEGEKYEPRALVLKSVIFHTLPKTYSVTDVDFKVYIGERKTEVFHYKNYVELNKLKDEPKVNKAEKKKKKEKKKDKGKEVGDYAVSTNGHEAEEDEEEMAEFDLGVGVPVFGDVKMDFENKGGRVFMFWFNTFFVKDLRLVIDKEGLDKAHKDAKNDKHKLYSKNFTVELVFSEVTPSSPTTAAASNSTNTN